MRSTKVSKGITSNPTIFIASRLLGCGGPTWPHSSMIPPRPRGRKGTGVLFGSDGGGGGWSSWGARGRVGRRSERGYSEPLLLGLARVVELERPWPLVAPARLCRRIVDRGNPLPRPPCPGPPHTPP